MTNMGETKCMDMIEKLNEEHDEVLTENARLTNELEKIKEENEKLKEENRIIKETLQKLDSLISPVLYG